MRTIQAGITMSCCLFALVVQAQTRKAGLWELTTTQTFQQSPFPAGASPGSGTHTTQVCLTEAQIEKYGAIMPQTHGNCQVTNIVKKPGGMTADMVCTGPMSGKGTVESSSTDGIHATGSVHFVGTVGVGANVKPIEWTSTSNSVFKGADCGDVKPIPMPDK
jgi:Protein of unknown function (DUF3617)